MKRKSMGIIIALSLWLVPVLFAAGPAARPNVLFAIADDWGWHAGAYGAGPWIKTPGFDRMAKEGLLFTNAFTPNAKCAPSRAMILTGRYSWQLKEAANHIPYFPLEFKTYPEALAENGYFVGVTGKGWAPGVARDADGKPRQLCGQAFNARKAPPPAKGISNNDYAANFIDFLEAVPEGKPWCFWFGALEPHRGYEYGSGVSKGGKDISQVDDVPDYWPDVDVVRNDILDYAYEVEHMDRHFVRMLEELEKRGLLDNTLIIYTSDHGMPFPRVKGQAYLHSNHIPLAVRWPGGIRKPGRVIDDFVNFTDVAPTILDAAGLAWSDSGMANHAGGSLRPIFESDKAGQVMPKRDHVLVGKERHDVGRPADAGYPIRGLLKDGFLYLRNFETARWPAGNPETGYLNTDGSPTKTYILDARRKNPSDSYWKLSFGKRPPEELYDLKRDPDCVRNLAGEADYAARRQQMQEQMTAELKVQGDPRMFGQGEIFDRYPVANEASRNFYERFMAGEKIKAGWVNDTDYEKEPLE